MATTKQSADPNGVEFDSPGRSAAELWVDGPKGKRKPQRGVTPLIALLGRAWNFGSSAPPIDPLMQPARRVLRAQYLSARLGMTPFQGYGLHTNPKTQGFTLGYRMTPVPGYGRPLQ